MKVHPGALLLIPALITGCSEGSKISSRITEQFDRGTSIDLDQAFPKGWDRVCILGPYSVNEDAASALGFPWNAEANTSIAMSDGINVLVFAKDQTVVAHVEHPRNKGDFSRVTPDCAPRSQAKLVRQPSSAELAWRQ